jgi:arginase
VTDVAGSPNRLRAASVRPILVPMAIGAIKTGVELGAAEIDRALRAGLAARNRSALLERLAPPRSVTVAPLAPGDERRCPGQALFLDEIAEASKSIATHVSAAIEAGALALVIGGDHAASIGSIAGASVAAERLAVIWIDAHADMNWPEVSLTGRLHGMSLGASLGRGHERVVSLFGKQPKLREDDAYLLGLRLLDPGEEEWLTDAGCYVATMPDVDSIGVDAAIQFVIARIQSSGVDAVHVSFDVDVLDPSVLSGTGWPERGGFTYREAARILRLIRQSDLPVRSLDWVEVNPRLDPSGGSVAVAADLLAVALGDEVLPARLFTGY